MKYRVGVDIGGTFADFAVLDQNSKIYTLKVLTTPTNPGQEIINGLAELKKLYGIEPSAIEYFTHGTTVGVNTLIQRNGAKLVYITTAGFEDMLELARLRTPDMYSLYSQRAKPLIAREMTVGLNERILSDGSVGIPLDEDGVVEAARLAAEEGAVGIVVNLINAYRNPAHERRVKEILARQVPDLFVTCSSEVWGVIREYERGVIASINAYVQPKMAHYLTRLQAALKNQGVQTELQITKSNGGVMRAEIGKKACVDVLLSGTASGVSGAAFVARQSGYESVASLDIGGTSADVALILSGMPQFSSREEVGEFSLHVPSVSVTSIGCGGGSIGWVDDHGVLKSGPESAGSEPGPACYGRGGQHPTTTDAFVVSGFVGQMPLAYGAVSIDRDKAAAAVKTLADKLSLGIEQTAEKLIGVTVSGMYAGMTKMFARHGTDAKSFVLMAFGGGGPMMACFLAKELGIGTVLIPSTPGVLSALGGLIADTKSDFITTVYGVLSAHVVPALHAARKDLEQRAWDWLKTSTDNTAQAVVNYSADMRYAGQSFEIETILDECWILSGNVDAIAAAFHKRHAELYDHFDPNAPIQVINLRAVISAPNPQPSFKRKPEETYTPTPDRFAQVYYGGAYHDAACHHREDLNPGARIKGPAIVAQSDTTTCILPGFNGRVDGFGNLILEEERFA